MMRVLLALIVSVVDGRAISTLHWQVRCWRGCEQPGFVAVSSFEILSTNIATSSRNDDVACPIHDIPHGIFWMVATHVISQIAGTKLDA